MGGCGCLSLARKRAGTTVLHGVADIWNRCDTWRNVVLPCAAAEYTESAMRTPMGPVLAAWWRTRGAHASPPLG